MSGEAAVMIVLQYIHRYLKPPVYCGKINERAFEEESYSRWAAYEIIDLLSNNLAKSACVVIDEFIVKMDQYSCSPKYDEKQRWRYSVAHDEAEEIQSLFV